MKRSYRRLAVALAVLVVVAAGSSVLYAQAVAGSGVGFSVMKALAETGSADAVPVAASGIGRFGERHMSCGGEGASCSGEEGGASCTMGKSGALSGEDASSVAIPKEATDGEAAAATCTGRTDEDCSTCDEKGTCSIHAEKEHAVAPDSSTL